MLASFRAETLKLRKRPGVWVLSVVWLALPVLFGVVIPYIAYRVLAGEGSGEFGNPQELLAGLLPQSLVRAAAGAFPFFGGALALVFGSLLWGGEYGWNTLKTILTQRPARMGVYGGKALALAAYLALLVLATFCLFAVASAVVASLENAAISWPSASELLRGVGVSLLIVAAWASFGWFLAVLFRSSALAIGLGLVWILVVENLISGLSAVWRPLATVNQGLLGVNANSLAGSMSGPASPEFGAPTLTALHSTVVLLVYLAAFLGLGALVLRTRDVT
jgi:ABC-type transport system involved in multi-copper enzyme maturation permease subunit